MKKTIALLFGLILLMISGCSGHYNNRPFDWGRAQMYRDIGSSPWRIYRNPTYQFYNQHSRSHMFDY